MKRLLKKLKAKGWHRPKVKIYRATSADDPEKAADEKRLGLKDFGISISFRRDF